MLGTNKSLYPVDSVPPKDRLVKFQQWDLTRSRFKILEVGQAVSRYYSKNKGRWASSLTFTIRLTRYKYIEELNVHQTTYINLSMNIYSEILYFQSKIEYYLDARQEATIFRNKKLHIFTQRPVRKPRFNEFMLCFQSKGRRIYMIKRTFQNLISKQHEIQNEFDMYRQSRGAY